MLCINGAKDSCSSSRLLPSSRATSKASKANMQVYGADKVWHQALVLAVAADWDNELLDLGEVDHFNQALGYREWPKAESLIARLDD